MRRKRSKASSYSASHSDVLATEDRRRNKLRGQNDRDKSRSKSRSRYENVTCHYWNNKVHIKKYYYRIRREIKQQKKYGDNKNCVATIVKVDLVFTWGEDIINLVCDET